jgi:hypothetical protein
MSGRILYFLVRIDMDLCYYTYLYHEQYKELSQIGSLLHPCLDTLALFSLFQQDCSHLTWALAQEVVRAVVIPATNRSRIWETHTVPAALPDKHETLRRRLQSRPISNRSRRGTSTTFLQILEQGGHVLRSMSASLLSHCPLHQDAKVHVHSCAGRSSQCTVV